MSIFLAANQAKSTLAGAISSGAVACTLAAGTGALFPSPGAGQYFAMTFISATNPLLREIVYVTAIAGDNITAMLRGQEGTSAEAWNVNDLAQNLVTAGWMNAVLQAAEQQAQTFTFFPDSGAADASVITPNPAITANTEGLAFSTVIAHTNLTATPKITVGSAPQTTIVGPTGAGIPIGGLPAGAVVNLVCNASGAYQLVSAPAGSNVNLSGTTTVSALVANGTATMNGGFNANGVLIANNTATFNSNIVTPIGTGIDSSGNFVFNNLQNNNVVHLNPSNALVTFENPAGNPLAVYYAGSSALIATISCGSNMTTGELIAFNYRGGNVGNITTNGTNTTYATASDHRLKTNLRPMLGASEMLMSIPVRMGQFTGHEDQAEQAMFLAHELQAVVPVAVTGEKDQEVDLGETYVPAGTVAKEWVPEPDRLPAGLTWQQTTELAEDSAEPALGALVFVDDHVLRTDVPEPHEDDAIPGVVWRFTKRVPKYQNVDNSFVVPVLVAGFQEQKTRADRLEQTVQVLVRIVSELSPESAAELQALLAPARSDDRAPLALPAPDAPAPDAPEPEPKRARKSRGDS